jgi:uncharacterized protein (UPF0276 family)
LLAATGAVDFVEAHAENYMGSGGPPHRWLSAIRERFPLSFHGVCLSIGGRDPLDVDHLRRLAAIVDIYQPDLVSEHLAWSADGGIFLNDLLPPPLTKSSLLTIVAHVDQVQSALKRTILVENPSSYLAFACADYSEPDFINELALRTGCGILLDINNVYVSAFNLGFSADKYVDAIDAGRVFEIHMAGHALDEFDGGALRIDNHGSAPSNEVCDLYQRFIRRAGPRPTLLEWDTDIPEFDVMTAETARLRRLMKEATPAREAIDA